MLGPLLYIFAVTVQAFLGGNLLMFLAITVVFFGYYIFFRSAYELSEFALIAILFLTLLNISEFKSAGDMRFGYSRIVIQAAVIAVIMFKRQISLMNIVRAQPWILLFGVWALASAPLGLAPARTMIYAIWFLLSIAMVIVHGMIAPNMRVALRSLCWAVLLSYGLAIVPSILEMIVNPGVLSRQFQSPIGMRHVPAQGVSLTIAALLYLQEEGRWRAIWRPLIWAFVILGSAVAIASLNRTAWFALAIALGGYFVIRPRNWLRDVTVAGVGAVVLGLFVTSASDLAKRIPKATQQRWELTTESGGALAQADWEHTDERIFVWRDKMKFVATHPVAGAGLVNSIRATTGEVPDPDMQYMSAHSTFVGVLVETGYVGATIFAFFLIGALVRAIRLFRTGQEFRYLVILALSSLTLSLFEFNGTPGQATFWPFFATIVLLAMRRDWLAAPARVRAPSAPMALPGQPALRGI